jgi:anti-sigma factor RsiW
MTGQHEHLPPDDEADLAAFADGCLFGPRRAELEARVATDAELAAALERQRAALAMIATGSPAVPAALRRRVEELEAARPAARAPWRIRPRRRLVPAAALALAATLLAFALLAGRGPAVGDVLAVALRPATAPATTTEAFEGIRFPHYAQWRATGARTDVVDGRRVRTVFYERGGRTIAYAIVAGPALSEDGALRTVRGPGRVVAVTWTRGGRTCVIAGSGVDADVLARLAVW